jgi:hypothetical protein
MMFSQDQWLNKFSPYPGRALPWPSSYVGTPTDAHGNPIQSYLDTQAKHDAWQAAQPKTAAPVTLNTNPAAGQTFGLQPSDLAGPSELNPSGNLAVGMADWGGMMSPQARDLYRNSQFQNPGGGYTNPDLVTTAGGQGAAGAAAAAKAKAQPAATNPYDMNAAYLTALSNPGHVNTPGATVPQSAPPSNQSGVLQQFLQNWQGGGGQTKGAGNYNNSGFFNALKGMV